MNEALLIIDMQKMVVNKMVVSGKEIISNVEKILSVYRGKKKPVIHVRRVHRADGIDVEKFRVEKFRKKPFLIEGTDGVEIIDELKPVDGEYIIDKQRFSAFFQSELEMILRRLGVDTLVVTGVQTPNCIRATVVDAIGYDYDVIVVEDAVAAQTKEIHEANLLDMENMGVEVKSADELIRRIS